MTFWSPEKTEGLKRLHLEGKAYPVIAAELGTTRGAVCAKVDRLGLAQAGAKGARRNYNKRKAVDDDPMRKDTRAMSDNELFTPPESRKSLVGLLDGECRYPHGDVGAPGFHFCSRPALMGKRYCGEHCRRAFLPVKPTPPMPRERMTQLRLRIGASTPRPMR